MLSENIRDKLVKHSVLNTQLFLLQIKQRVEYRINILVLILIFMCGVQIYLSYIFINPRDSIYITPQQQMIIMFIVSLMTLKIIHTIYTELGIYKHILASTILVIDQINNIHNVMSNITETRIVSYLQMYISDISITTHKTEDVVYDNLIHGGILT